MAQLEALSIKRKRGGKCQDGTGKFYVNNVLPSCGEGWWMSQWSGCLLFLQRWNHHHPPNQRVLHMNHGSRRTQICFSKVRGSLGVYFPWKSGRCFSKCYLWLLLEAWMLSSDFSLVWSFFCIHSWHFPCYHSPEKQKGWWWGCQTKSFLLYPLPDKYLFQFFSFCTGNQNPLTMAALYWTCWNCATWQNMVLMASMESRRLLHPRAYVEGLK